MFPIDNTMTVGALITFGATIGGFVYTWYRDKKVRTKMQKEVIEKVQEGNNSAHTAYKEANEVNIKIHALAKEIKEIKLSLRQPKRKRK